MTVATLARRRTWRMFPVLAGAAALNASVLMGVLYWRAAATRGSVSAAALILAAWLGVALYLAFSDVRTRCTPFEQSLPVSARKLWWNHVIFLVAGALGIVVLTLGVIAVHRRLPVAVDIELGSWALGAILFAGGVLATLLLQAPRPSLSRIPVTRGTVAWTIGVLVATPVVLAVAARAGWWGVGVVVVVAAAVGFWTYRGVPASYAVAPLESAAGTRVGPSAVPVPDEGAGPSRMLAALTVVRCVSAGAKELLGVPMVALFGVILGGGLLAIDTEITRDVRFLFVPMVIYMLFALIGPRLASLHHIDPLPISRRPLAAALVVPYLVVVVAGYGAGVLLASQTRSRTEYVNMQQTEKGWEVTVPLRVYRLTWSGNVPAVGSPWGESQVPTALRLYAPAPVAVYSPYSAPPGSSARFVALQISRAVEDVYGASIPADTIRQRYLTTGDDVGVVPRGEGLTLRRDYPGLTAASGPMFPALVAAAVVPWLLLTALLLRAYRAGVREWVRQTIVWGGLGLLMILWIAPWLATVSGILSSWAARALVEIPVMWAGGTPAGTLTVWSVALALVVAAYAIVQSQVLRMEIPSRPSQYTLLRSSAS